MSWLVEALVSHIRVHFQFYLLIPASHHCTPLKASLIARVTVLSLPCLETYTDFPMLNFSHGIPPATVGLITSKVNQYMGMFCIFPSQIKFLRNVKNMYYQAKDISCLCDPGQATHLAKPHYPLYQKQEQLCCQKWLTGLNDRIQTRALIIIPNMQQKTMLIIFLISHCFSQNAQV